MIVEVAIKTKDGKIWSLPKPNRHHHIFRVIFAEINNKEKAIEYCGNAVQGFRNSSGKFLNRKEAFLEALKNNQVLPPYNPTCPSKRRWDLEVDVTPRELFSEDLW